MKDAVELPVVASGGVSTAADVARLLVQPAVALPRRGPDEAAPDGEE